MNKYIVTPLTLNLCRFSESADLTESANGAVQGSPVTQRPSKSRSGAKPTIVSPLENVEVNDGENVNLQVKVGTVFQLAVLLKIVKILCPVPFCPSQFDQFQ